MASLTQWTWIWASSWRWGRTGKPGVLQSMGSQRVRRDWVTERQQQLFNRQIFFWHINKQINAYLIIKYFTDSYEYMVWQCLEYKTCVLHLSLLSFSEIGGTAHLVSLGDILLFILQRQTFWDFLGQTPLEIFHVNVTWHGTYTENFFFFLYWVFKWFLKWPLWWLVL